MKELLKRGVVRYIFLIVLIVGNGSCRKHLISREPREKAMKYYNKDFILSDASKLRINGVYYRIFSDEHGNKWVGLFQFYKNGKLRSASMVNSTLMIKDNMLKNDEVRGYYKFDGDSLRFTRDAHYFRKSQEYVGYFNGDTLFLKYIKSTRGFESYFFMKSGNILETGIDEKSYK